MTRYSRSVIPGRQTGEAPTLASEIDNLVFGKESSNRKGGESAGEAEELSESETISFVERAASDRRKGAKRRGSDFAPLPGEAAAARSSEAGSKRGPVLLGGALVIVAVFGVVVWNAYRDGVRPEDSAVTPQLADAGPFKSKPAQAETRAKAAGPAEESVFDQVEARPNAAPAPAPEVREAEAASQALPEPVQTAAVEAPKPTAPTKAAPAPKAEAPKPAGPKATAPAPAPKPAQVVVATKQATPVALAGGYSPAFASGGKFVVQIAAPSSEDGAIAEWKKGARKAPGLFQSAERIIVQADVNGHTVYRLRAGSFATGADADAFCDAFKAAGGQCFRTAK